MDLPPQELRVLGCLVEKQLTTPQQYPLTLNALALACNQSSNRFPVVSYDETTVEAAVTSAKSRGLARFVHPSHGRSAIRYAHMLEEVLGIDTPQLALLAVLMLRGPQTPGELRARTERMTSFEDLATVEHELELLAQRREPLVVRLRREPGQKEDRFAQLLGGAPTATQMHEHPWDAQRAAERATAGERPGTMDPSGAGAAEPRLFAHGSVRGSSEPDTDGPVASQAPLALEEAVSELRDEVAHLRRQLDDLRAQLGG